VCPAHILCRCRWNPSSDFDILRVLLSCHPLHLRSEICSISPEGYFLVVRVAFARGDSEVDMSTVTTTVASLISTTVTVTASAASASSTAAKAAPQGGILDGILPNVYSASNPIQLFIIQVWCHPPFPSVAEDACHPKNRACMPVPGSGPLAFADGVFSRTPEWEQSLTGNCPIGRYHHHPLPSVTLPAVPDWPAPCHCRSHWRYPSRTIRPCAGAGLLQCHLPDRVPAGVE
jgi:hypothetical protein